MINTLQDLVDTLNKNFDNEFDLFDKENGFEFCLRVDGAPTIDFNSRDKSFEFQSFIEYVHGKGLNIIVNFLANSNPDNWFKEKKYNIIVGPSYKDGNVAAYHKTEKEVWFNEFDEVMCLDAFVSKDDLKRDDYMFTEQEITTLKMSLPENMQQIVDLGKTEVEDERKTF